MVNGAIGLFGKNAIRHVAEGPGFEPESVLHQSLVERAVKD